MILLYFMQISLSLSLSRFQARFRIYLIAWSREKSTLSKRLMRVVKKWLFISMLPVDESRYRGIMNFVVGDCDLRNQSAIKTNCGGSNLVLRLLIIP